MAAPSANLVNIRNTMALAHFNEASILGKTLDIYLGATYEVGGAALYVGMVAKARACNKREQEIFGNIHGIMFDKVFEIPRQRGATFAEIVPHRFKIIFDGMVYEIQTIQRDDAENMEEASVLTCFCTRLGSEVGKFVR